MFRELFDAERDERSSLVSGRCAVVVLGITQILLLLSVLHRRYILHQASSQIWDIQSILAISIFGFIGARLYLGGALPVLSLKSALIAYIALVAVVTGGSLLLLGVPDPSQWANTWLPALLGPALLIGLYSLVAYLGRRRLERMIDSKE